MLVARTTLKDAIKTWKHSEWLSLGLFIATLLFLMYYFVYKSTEELTVRLALVVPLNGDLAPLGAEVLQGTNRALSDLRREDLYIGRHRMRIELQVEDDAGDPEKAVAIAQKLVRQKVHAVIGHLNSSATLAAAPIYAQQGIVQITPSSTHPDLTRQLYETLFRVIPNDAFVGQQLAEFVLLKLQARTITLVDDRSMYAQGLANEFYQHFEKKGGRTQAHLFLTHAGKNNIAALAASIKLESPEAVFFAGTDEAAIGLLQALQHVKISIPFITGNLACTERLRQAAEKPKKSTMPVFCVSYGSSASVGIAIKDNFSARHLEQNEKVPKSSYAPYAYDAVRIVISAIQRAKSPDAQRFLPFLRQIQYQGITGFSAFDAHGDALHPHLYLLSFANDKQSFFRLLEN